MCWKMPESAEKYQKIPENARRCQKVPEGVSISEMCIRLSHNI